MGHLCSSHCTLCPSSLFIYGSTFSLCPFTAPLCPSAAPLLPRLGDISQRWGSLWLSSFVSSSTNIFIIYFGHSLSLSPVSLSSLCSSACLHSSCLNPDNLFTSFILLYLHCHLLEVWIGFMYLMLLMWACNICDPYECKKTVCLIFYTLPIVTNDHLLATSPLPTR